MICSISFVSSAFTILSKIRPVATRISTAGIRPPVRRSTRRWLTMPRSEPASDMRTWRCSWGGKKSMMRLIESVALVDDRRLVGVEDLDGVLDRHDVLVLGLVDVVDHRTERRGLPRAGRAGHEHQSALVLRELPHDRRQPQLLE